MDEMTDSDRLEHLEHLASGKVREVYRVDAQRLLFVASDRLSAFDVVMPTPIPGKGRVLTAVSRFWFENTRDIVPNHFLGTDLSGLPLNDRERTWLDGRSMLVKACRVLPVEAIVRGYLAGSGWKDYQASGQVCGHALPAGMRLAERLPEPLFTPSTKAALGAHDENISLTQLAETIGPALAEQVREASLSLYRHAADYARERGIIIADTKFEFGLDTDGRLTLVDEALTPDSSRFWPVDSYRPGISPPSFDKQFVRDWLETLDWDKCAPGPEIPADIVRRTQEKYAEALDRLTRQ